MALEHTCKKRMEDDVTMEMEGAAQKAVVNVMLQLRSKQQLLIDSMNGSVGKAVNNTDSGFTSDLHKRMQLREWQIETQLNSQILQHWDLFVKNARTRTCSWNLAQKKARLPRPSTALELVCKTRW